MKFYLKSEEFLKVFPKTFLCANADLFEEKVSIPIYLFTWSSFSLHFLHSSLLPFLHPFYKKFYL